MSISAKTPSLLCVATGYARSKLLPAPAADVFTVDVSNNNGGSWVNAETVGPASQNNGGWIYHEFRLASFVAPSASVLVRFIASEWGFPYPEKLSTTGLPS